MIVPSARLIWLAVLGVPAVVVEALVPGARPAAAVLVTALCAAAVADAALRTRALAGIRVELPPLLRLVQGREAQILVRIHNASHTARRIRLGLAVPEEIAAEPEEQWLSLSAQVPCFEVSWKCLPRVRGNYRIEECYLEAPSPLGLWAVRQSVPSSLEIRVYPNLRQDLTLSALRRGSQDRHTTRQIGRGREFEKLREYSPGDGSDEVYWKATARRGRPITKVFQIERTQEVFVAIDTSRLSGRTVDGEVALERAIKAALTINAVTERRGDLFGVAAFSSQMEAFVPARRGKIQYAACRDAINDLRVRPGSPDFEEVSTFLRLHLHRRALILFLTSLDDPILAEHFVRSTRLLTRRHLVMAGMLKPASTQPLFSDAHVESTEDIYRALTGHLGWHKLREVQRALARQGVQLALLGPESFTAGLIKLYDNAKQRQLL